MDEYYKACPAGSRGLKNKMSSTTGFSKTRSPDMRTSTRMVFGGYLQTYPEACHQEKREEGFINQPDAQYLNAYAVEFLMELVGREHKNRFTDLLHENKTIGRSDRAQMIDMLFSLAANLKIDDKQVVYQTVGYIDRFFSQRQFECKDLSDCCLTGYASLFIASKNSEVEPLSLRDVRDHFLHGQYDRMAIVNREHAIRQCINYENEVTYMFDFVMLLMKLWKMSC